MTELPEGWTEVSLRDVTVDVANARPDVEPRRTFHYVDISSIDNREFRVRPEEIKSFKGSDAPSRARRPIQTHDVIFSNVRTYLRNIALVEPELGADLCSTGFTVLRPSAAVDPRYLFRWVLSEEFLGAVTPEQTGTHYPATSDRVVRNQRIRLPPLAEQKRIVEKVEALLAQVQAARDRLERVQQILKRFRQAVLAAACEGRLTASDSDSWWTTTLGAVCREITVGHVGPMAGEYIPSGVPFLRSQNVRPFRFDPTRLKFVSRSFHERLGKTKLKPGDVLVVRSGNAGVACVVPPDLLEANCADLVILRPSEHLDPYFAVLFLNSSAARSHVDQVKVGIAQGHFNIGDAREMPIRLPPVEDQREIVDRAFALLSLADDIERRCMRVRSAHDAMPQAVLAKAFVGELVETEAELALAEGREYESGKELLARIWAARVRMGVGGGSAPKRRTAQKG